MFCLRTCDYVCPSIIMPILSLVNGLWIHVSRNGGSSVILINANKSLSFTFVTFLNLSLFVIHLPQSVTVFLKVGIYDRKHREQFALMWHVLFWHFVSERFSWRTHHFYGLKKHMWDLFMFQKPQNYSICF